MKARCIPICKSCREANKCHRVPVQQPWKPDRLTGKTLQCGHICDVLPIVQGIVDRQGHCMASHVLCDTCHEWQPIRWKDQMPQTEQDEAPKQLVIPF